VLNGQFEEALRDAERFRVEIPSLSSEAHEGYVFARKGDLREARAILADLQKKDDDESDPLPVLTVQIALNEKEAAFASLERAYQLHSNAITSLKVNPIYDPLRKDPRFTDLMRRVGLDK
jgi:hypothetical protein